MSRSTKKMWVIGTVVLALVASIALAATFHLSVPSQIIKADNVLTSTSDFLGVYFDEALTQPVLSLDFGDMSDRGCGAKVPKLFIKNQSEERLSNIYPDAPLPLSPAYPYTIPFFEAQFAAKRSDGTRYDGGIVEPQEMITMYVWVCDTQGQNLPPDPKTYDDLEVRLNAEIAETTQQ